MEFWGVEVAGWVVGGDDTDGLEVGIDDGCADEFHAAFLEVF